MQGVSRYRLAGLAGSVLLLVVFVAPFLSFAKSTTQLYVDASASGTQNGSQAHPFKKIGDALDKAHGKADVHVANGTYHEDITIPKNVRLYGNDQNKTIIDGSNHGDAVVTMNEDTTLDKFTVRNGGGHGIRITKGSKASIVRCSIEGNDKDGINIRGGNTKKSDTVSISETEIRDNGRAGIYAEKRRIGIVESDIKSNHDDGIAIAAGSVVFFDNSSVSNNRGSGLSVALDGTSVYVAGGDTFRNNKLDGISITSNGGTGSVIVKKSRLSENGHYGVSRTAKNNAPASVWKGVSVEDANNYFGNGHGNISPILK